jgi:rare lipoprotein A
VSYQAAEILGFRNKGSAHVEVRYVGPAPLNGDDNRMLMASVNKLTKLEQQLAAQPAWPEAPEIVMASTGHVNLGDVATPWPASRNPLSGGLIGDLIGGLAYAESDVSVNGAIEAATAMATRAPQLDGWVAAVDEDSRKLKLQLGIFGDSAGAIEVATRFAMLGAVDEEDVVLGDRHATRLTLTMLKPGVSRADALALARELGLADLVLY